MAAVGFEKIEHEVRKAELLGDPMAPVLRVLLDQQRDGINEESLRLLAYEAAAGARSEMRKLVEIEVKRMWIRYAPWLLLAVLAGFSAGLLVR